MSVHLATVAGGGHVACPSCHLGGASGVPGGGGAERASQGSQI